MLLAAKNPVIWAGQGVLYAQASEQLAALAELLPAPVVCTNPGKSAIPDEHPLALGASTRNQPAAYTHYLGAADVVFAVGSSLTNTSFGPCVAGGQDDHPFDQRSERRQQGHPRGCGADRRRGAGARSADRRDRPTKGRAEAATRRPL